MNHIHFFGLGQEEKPEQKMMKAATDLMRD